MVYNRNKWHAQHTVDGGVAMNEVLINILVARIKAGQMTIEQVPIPYQEEVQVRLEQQAQ